MSSSHRSIAATSWYRRRFWWSRRSRRRCKTRSSRRKSNWTRWFCTSRIALGVVTSIEGRSQSRLHQHRLSLTHPIIIHTGCLPIWQETPVEVITRLRCATKTMRRMMMAWTTMVMKRRWQWQSRAPIFATLASLIWLTCSKYSSICLLHHRTHIMLPNHQPSLVKSTSPGTPYWTDPVGEMTRWLSTAVILRIELKYTPFQYLIRLRHNKMPLARTPPRHAIIVWPWLIHWNYSHCIRLRRHFWRLMRKQWLCGRTKARSTSSRWESVGLHPSIYSIKMDLSGKRPLIQ